MNAHKENLRERLDFYGVDQEERLFSAIRHLLEAHVDEALDRFYDKIRSNQETSRFFPSEQMIGHAHSAQKSHWLRIFNEGLEGDYLNRAIRIGDTHARIGLEPKWYIGGYATILEQLIEQAVTGGPRRMMPGQRKLAKKIATIVKVALLDMDLALSTYFVKAEENVRLTVVNKIGDAMAQISSGNLAVRIHDLPESYAKLQIDFNAAIEKLQATINTVAEGAESITTGAAEIRSASDDLSHRTEEQAAQLEESAAAMNRLTDAITETSRAIAGLNGSVNLTHKEAVRGSEVVSSAVKAMADIQKSSDSIAEIIKIIDGIAFQTNLLALNAGVEAARVGDLGKGFAVVANEVRALAQRSSEAAEQIKHLISESMGQVEGGVKLVNDTGAVLEAILSQMGDLTTVAEQISESTEAQSNNLKQINHAVGEMDKVTQQNAAMVEEATAAARAMAGEAERLSSTVGQFSADGGQRKMPAKPARAASPRPLPGTNGNAALAIDKEDWSDF